MVGDGAAAGRARLRRPRTAWPDGRRSSASWPIMRRIWRPPPAPTRTWRARSSGHDRGRLAARGLHQQAGGDGPGAVLGGTRPRRPASRAIGGGDSFPTRKPDPAHIAGDVAAAGGTPERAVMAGDHANDVAAARGAGLPCIFAGWGYGPPGWRPGRRRSPSASTICRPSPRACSLADHLRARHDGHGVAEPMRREAEANRQRRASGNTCANQAAPRCG